MTRQPNTSKTLVADSSAIISLVIDTDHNHDRALAVTKRLEQTDGVILVPCDVFAETLNILGKKLGKNVACKTGTVLLTTPAFSVVDSNEEIRQDAFDKFPQQAPSVSYTDCVVMATADFYGAEEIFGFDEVFAKNDYRTPQEV